jgi:iron(III) transport system substrate-binding protein
MRRVPFFIDLSECILLLGRASGFSVECTTPRGEYPDTGALNLDYWSCDMTDTLRAVRRIQTLSALAALTLSASAFAAMAAEVNIYSSREPQLVEPMLKAFSDKTGIKTNVVFVRDGLNERLAAEARNSPADVMLTVDITRLTEAKDQGLTQPVVSQPVNAIVPANLRDPEGNWVALTLRARVVYASKERVKQDAITYEELADPKWRGKLCSRSGQHPYNTAAIAAMIAHKGAEAAEAWLKGVKANLAHKPAGGDREQVRDVFAGKCDLALGNTYYMGLMQTNEKNPEQKHWASAVKVLFPNAGDRGTHVNVSGVAVAKNAPNRDSAVKLVEFLVSDEAQRLYASVNHEYPVNPKLEPSATVKAWGTLKADSLPLGDISKHRKQASEIVDKVNFDAGPSS